MTSKDVTALRKQGKLEEAIKLSDKLLLAEPENVWNKRAASWVYYDYLKLYAKEDTYDQFYEYLLKIKDFNFGDGENMLFDNVAFQIGKLVFDLKKSDSVDIEKVNKLFEIIQDFNFTKPSEGYSFIFKAFHKNYLDWSKYIKFADWWGFDNFQDKDYLPEDLNGKSIMSLVEQAYIAYSKKVMVNKFGVKGRGRLGIFKFDNELAESFIPKLKNIVESRPEYKYPLYYLSKMLLNLKRYDETLKYLIPFAKKNSSEYWVWDALSEAFKNDLDSQKVCICKALSLNAPGEFVNNIRLRLAKILIEEKQYNEAKTEIELVIANKEQNGYSIPNEIIEFKNNAWYQEATSQGNNSKYYNLYLTKADEILFNDIEEETIVVEFVNSDKGILHFVKTKTKHGFFKYKGKLPKPAIGDVLSVRFIGNPDDKYYKIATVKEVVDDGSLDSIKQFKGCIKIMKDKNFAFVEDVFIDSKLLGTLNPINEDQIIGKAILSFNKKKNEWGWKAISIQSEQ